MNFNILIIDDEKNIRSGLSDSLELEGYNTFTAENGKQGLERFSKGDIDLVITDLRMPEITGEAVIKQITSENPGVPVIVLTGHGSIDSAVEAMRNGAYDFLTKPLNLDQLTMIVKRALEGRELALQHRELVKELDSKKAFESIIGKSSEMQKIFTVIRKVAETKSSVLITGESGVGKELVAHAIHNLSKRNNKRMISVNCSALSKELLETELFGHEKGAFTGANSLHRGRFELADNSTLFLDEIGEIDQNIQVKILRVLQEKAFERVGGENTINVDVRIIAATNRDLEKEVAEGRFRQDLFYRLNVVHIHVPPLRERKDDIPLMITSFIQEFSKENGKRIEGIDYQARNAIYAYDWPGNIRELRNCIESAVVMCESNIITINDLPPSVNNNSALENMIQIPAGITMDEAEKIIIQHNLAINKGNKSKTADMLGIGRKTLHRKLEDYEKGDSL